MSTAHDPFRGYPAPVLPDPAPDEATLRAEIVGWFDARNLAPTVEMFDAFEAMSIEQLVVTLRELAGLEGRNGEWVIPRPPGSEPPGLQEIPGVDVTDDADVGEPPDDARDLVDWITTPAHARVALAHEEARPPTRQRTTVLDRARQVLDG